MKAAAGLGALAAVAVALRLRKQRCEPLCSGGGGGSAATRTAAPTDGGRRRFAGQVALVTGAGSGIGRATAIRLALEGAAVAVNDLPSNEAGIRGTIEAARRLNPDAVLRGFPFDVSDRNAVEKSIDAICSADAAVGFGRLDVVVTNAYFSHRRHFLELDWSQVHKTFDVTLFGAFHVLQFAARKMAMQPVVVDPHDDPDDELTVRRGTRGVFVLMSSIMSVVPFAIPSSVAYNAAKAGSDSMVLTLASDLAEHQIRVVGINPGWIDTAGERQFTSEEEMRKSGKHLPMGLGRPQDVAKAVAFLASREATYITGCSLHVDGGFRISHRVPGIHTPIKVPGV